MNKSFRRAVPLALCLALACPSFAAAVPDPAPASSQIRHPDAAQWREDLRFMVAEMNRRHPDLHHAASRERFERAVADLDARIPSLQRHEIIVGLMRIAAMIGDGHTRVEPRKDAAFGFRSLPLKLYLFEDGLFVRAARPDHAALVGAEIVEIGGVPIAEALRRVAEISSQDNPMGAALYASLFLNMPPILHALQLSETPDAAILKLRKNGRAWTATVAAGEVDPPWPPDTDISLVTPPNWVDARSTDTPPLWLQEPLDYHRLVELPGRRAIYAQLNMVAHGKDQTLAGFGRAIRERAEASNPKAIILDLRLNHGGNGELASPFVRELIRAEDEDTQLFVLTWRGTYSASQFILDDLDRLSGAIFVGEPASSRPTSFGDSYRARLPHSGITVRTSILRWQERQNRSPWTWVDIAAPLRFADYASGRDPALEAALAHAPRASLVEQLAAARGAAEVVRRLEEYRSDPVNQYADLERHMLRSVERLAADRKLEEASAAAELAASWFPDSADAQLVRGLVADLVGNADVALRAARRTLELDPNNRSGRSLLERHVGPDSGA